MAHRGLLSTRSGQLQPFQTKGASILAVTLVFLAIIAGVGSASGGTTGALVVGLWTILLFPGVASYLSRYLARVLGLLLVLISLNWFTTWIPGLVIPVAGSSVLPLNLTMVVVFGVMVFWLLRNRGIWRYLVLWKPVLGLVGLSLAAGLSAGFLQGNIPPTVLRDSRAMVFTLISLAVLGTCATSLAVLQRFRALTIGIGLAGTLSFVITWMLHLPLGQSTGVGPVETLSGQVIERAYGIPSSWIFMLFALFLVQARLLSHQSGSKGLRLMLIELLLGVPLVLLMTRGYYLSMLIGVVVLSIGGWLREGRIPLHFVLIVAAVIMLIALGVVAPNLFRGLSPQLAFVERFHSIFDPNSSSLDVNVAIRLEGIRLYERLDEWNWVSGIGYGDPAVADLTDRDMSLALYQGHSMYGWALAHMGFLGSLLWLAVASWLIYRAGRVVFASSNPILFSIGWGCIAYLAGLLGEGFSVNVIFGTSGEVPLVNAFALGLLLAAANLARREKAPPPSQE